MFKKVFLSMMIPSLLLVTHTIAADDKDDDKGRGDRSPGKERRESKRDNRSDRGDRKDNRQDRREENVRVETPRVEQRVRAETPRAEQKVRVETPRVEQNNERVNPFSGQKGRNEYSACHIYCRRGFDVKAGNKQRHQCYPDKGKPVGKVHV